MTLQYYEKSEVVAKANEFLFYAKPNETRRFQKTILDHTFEIITTRTDNWFNNYQIHPPTSTELDWDETDIRLPDLLLKAEQVAKKAKAPKPEPKIYISNQNLEV